MHLEPKQKVNLIPPTRQVYMMVQALTVRSITSYYSVLLRTTPYYFVLLRITSYYSVLLRTTPYYFVLLRITVFSHEIQKTGGGLGRFVFHAYSGKVCAMANTSKTRVNAQHCEIQI